jgi:hypothetical protein
MRKYLYLIVASLLAATSPALADWTGKDASSATITFKNPGTCSSVVCVPVVQLYDGTNVVTLTTAGADAASNTLTGVPVYGRNLVFNGTTWDRWTGAVTVTGVATASNQTSQITQETAINTVLGTQADAAWVSGSGTAVAILKNIAGGVAGSIPAGSALIGDVNVRQGGTALSTTNGLYSNLLQGNAVLSATNGTFANVLQGNAVLSATNPSPVAPNAYPVGATPLTASATGTTGATTATLAGTGAKTTYICSLSVRANATANANVTNTVTGVITGTLSRAMWIPANTAGLGVDEQIYTPCVPASGTNQAIAVVSGAPGTGGVVTVNATGYQQ